MQLAIDLWWFWLFLTVALWGYVAYRQWPVWREFGLMCKACLGYDVASSDMKPEDFRKLIVTRVKECFLPGLAATLSGGLCLMAIIYKLCL